MSAWKKSPPTLIAAFEKAKPSDPAVRSRLMFGYPALFLDGNMFAGTYQDKVIVRFGEDRSLAGAKSAKAFEPMLGRAMKEYVVVQTRSRRVRRSCARGSATRTSMRRSSRRRKAAS